MITEAPIDVQKVAYAVAKAFDVADPVQALALSELVGQAILDERERCAEVAEALEAVIPMWYRPGGPPGNGPMRHGTPKEIAAATRKGEA